MNGSGVFADGAAEATLVPPLPPERARARSPIGSSESGLTPAGAAPLPLGGTTTGTGGLVDGVTPAMLPLAVAPALAAGAAGGAGGLAAPALPASGAFGSQSLLRRAS